MHLMVDDSLQPKGCGYYILHVPCVIPYFFPWGHAIDSCIQPAKKSNIMTPPPPPPPRPQQNGKKLIIFSSWPVSFWTHVKSLKCVAILSNGWCMVWACFPESVNDSHSPVIHIAVGGHCYISHKNTSMWMQLTAIATQHIIIHRCAKWVS
jgi:hypothetical protein